MTFTGRRRQRAEAPFAAGVPLIVALHGGTYTSEYFDIPGYSLLDGAAALGIPAVAIDRPGYGASAPVAAPSSVILRHAEVLDQVIGELWQEWGAGTTGLFLIGHSIGAAVVSAIAARHPAWPLLGVAISGYLLELANPGRRGSIPEDPRFELPVEVKDRMMFGPEGTYDSAMPRAGDAANAPGLHAEVSDLNDHWMERVRRIHAEVEVPVQARQGEFDRLWVTDAQRVSEFAASFTASPRVDAQLVPSAGHCIDFHRAGAGFQLGQLGFAVECGVRARS